jgi:hypothetical protein
MACRKGGREPASPAPPPTIPARPPRPASGSARSSRTPCKARRRACSRRSISAALGSPCFSWRFSCTDAQRSTRSSSSCRIWASSESTRLALSTKARESREDTATVPRPREAAIAGTDSPLLLRSSTRAIVASWEAFLSPLPFRGLGDPGRAPRRREGGTPAFYAFSPPCNYRRLAPWEKGLSGWASGEASTGLLLVENRVLSIGTRASGTNSRRDYVNLRA